MTTLAERLNFLLKDKGLTQAQFAEMIGIKQPSAQKILAGDTKNPRNILDIANILGVDPNWLQSGIGSPTIVQGNAGIIGNNNTLNDSHIVMGERTAHRKKSVTPPLVAQADFSLPTLFKSVELNVNNGANAFFVASDNLMQPTIEQGDVVFVDRSISSFTGNGIYLLDSFGAVSIQRVQRLLNGKYRVFDDSNTQSIEMDETQFLDISLIGKVVDIWQVKKKM